jgi:hypothetical protein
MRVGRVVLRFPADAGVAVRLGPERSMAFEILRDGFGKVELGRNGGSIVCQVSAA